MNIPCITLQTGRKIGSGHPTYIIAEIGSNHDGDLSRAKMLIREAKIAGADAAKFQSFQVEKLLNPKWRVHGRWLSDPSWELLKKLSIPTEWHKELSDEARKIGIDFLSTAFDNERLEMLIDLNVSMLKIASGDLTYHQLLASAGKSGKPVIVSTGHALLGEVEAALTVLWEVGCKDIILLHCASIYPADYGDANIPAMMAMQHGFRVLVGYSDHTPGAVVPLGAVAQGACVIEKDITDDKTRKGPDHPFALDLTEFAAMTHQIRQLEKALVGQIKSYRIGEAEERVLARRALYAKTAIFKDTPLTLENVKIVRHAYSGGIPADHWEFVSGKPITRDVEADELICWDMI